MKNIREKKEMVKSKDSGFCFLSENITLENDMKESLVVMLEMGREFTLGPVVKSMKDFGRITTKMGRAFNTGLMAVGFKESGKMVCDMER